MQKKIQNTAPAFLNGAPGIAEYANVSRRLVVNWVKDGRPVKRLSARHFLARIEDVDQFIETRATEYATRVGIGGVR